MEKSMEKQVGFLQKIFEVAQQIIPILGVLVEKIVEFFQGKDKEINKNKDIAEGKENGNKTKEPKENQKSNNPLSSVKVGNTNNISSNNVGSGTSPQQEKGGRD
jgi:hypothetical protein